MKKHPLGKTILELSAFVSILCLNNVTYAQTSINQTIGEGLAHVQSTADMLETVAKTAKIVLNGGGDGAVLDKPINLVDISAQYLPLANKFSGATLAKKFDTSPYSVNIMDLQMCRTQATETGRVKEYSGTLESAAKSGEDLVTKFNEAEKRLTASKSVLDYLTASRAQLSAAPTYGQYFTGGVAPLIRTAGPEIERMQSSMKFHKGNVADEVLRIRAVRSRILKTAAEVKTDICFIKGAWKGTCKVDNANAGASLALEITDGRQRGRLSIVDIPRPTISGISVSQGNKLAFKTVMDGDLVKFQGTFSDNFSKLKLGIDESGDLEVSCSLKS